MSSEVDKEKSVQETINQNDSTKNSDEEIETTQVSISKDQNEESEESRKERERKISEEIDKAIQERKECIRKECMKAKKRLDLGSSRIDDLDTFTVALYLSEKHTNLELIHLGANLIGDEGLINILSGLQYHENSIREIYLGNNNFTTYGLQNLCEILPSFKNLETLSLGNIGLNNDVGVSLAYSLMDLKKLKSLMINTNKLGDDFFITLSILISCDKLKIKTLHMGENPVTSKGMIPLLKSIGHNDSIKDLYINDICLQNDTVKALSKMLVRNTTLTHLNLGNCGIDDESVLILKTGLVFNSSLKMLNLWCNRITDDGAFILLNVLLENNIYLSQITLSDNLIEEKTILEGIKLALKQNLTLPKNGEIKKDASKTSTNADQSKSKSLIEDPEKLKMITNLESEVKQLKEQLELKNKQIIELKEDNLNCL